MSPFIKHHHAPAYIHDTADERFHRWLAIGLVVILLAVVVTGVVR